MIIIEQWPKVKKFKFNKKQKMFSIHKVKKIEKFFANKYNYKYASLCPSGRAAINLILRYLKFDRSKVVSIPKWSSHCLFQGIGAVTNVSIRDKSADCVLIVHKWGKTNKFKKNNSKIFKIEDSADSLPGENFIPLENNSDFEIISLPKIIASLSGGVVISNNKNFFNYCKKKQKEEFKLGSYQVKKKFNYIFKERTSNEWFYNESFNTSFDDNAVKNIEDCIFNFEINKKIIQERQLKVKQYFKTLKFDKKRIGPCIIFKKKLFKEFSKILETKHFDFKQNVTREKYEECLIFPIHFGIKESVFKNKLDKLLKLKTK